MRDDVRPVSVGATAPLSSEATVELLSRVKAGDSAAAERLLARCIPPLRRWAHGRLPAYDRGVQDTTDLVNDAVFAALRCIEIREARHEGALQAYLRQAVMNRIRDVMRQRRRRPEQAKVPPDLPDTGASPLELAIGADNIDRYEEALKRLRPADREAIITRIELQYSYAEVAVALDAPTADAARVAVTHAVRRLVEEMHHGA